MTKYRTKLKFRSLSYTDHYIKSCMKDIIKSPYKAALLTITLFFLFYYPYHKTKVILQQIYSINIDLTKQKSHLTSAQSYYTYVPPIEPSTIKRFSTPFTNITSPDGGWSHAKYFGWHDCGPICDVETTGPGHQTKFYPFIAKEVNCKVMMGKLSSKTGPNLTYGWPPPREPPPELYREFTAAGKMPLMELAYFAERHNGNARNVSISKQEIAEKLLARAKRKGMSTYGAIVEDLVQVALSKYADYVENKTGCDFGSSANTWLTTLALLNGAKKMYIMDYQASISTHPQIETLVPQQLYKLWVNMHKSRKNRSPANIGLFDFVISYSSIEHSGLGRYGDDLNPYGDLIAASQIWCSLKSGSLLFLNVPYNPKGSALVWNAHRIYGPDRMAHLTANFEVLDYMDVCTMTRGLFCEHGTRLVTTLWVLRKI